MHKMFNIVAHALLKTAEPRVAAARERRLLAMKEIAARRQAAAPAQPDPEPDPGAAGERAAGQPAPEQAAGQGSPETQEQEASASHDAEATGSQHDQEPAPGAPVEEEDVDDSGGCWDQLDRDGRPLDDAGADIKPVPEDKEPEREVGATGAKKPNYEHWTPKHLGVRLRTEHDAGRGPAAPAVGLGHAANLDAYTVELLEFIEWAETHEDAVLDAPGNLLGGGPREGEKPGPRRDHVAESAPVAVPEPVAAASEAAPDRQVPPQEAERGQEPPQSPSQDLTEERIAAVVAEQVEARVAKATTDLEARITAAVAVSLRQQVEERVTHYLIPFAAQIQETLAPLNSTVAQLAEEAATKSEQRIAAAVGQRVARVERRIEQIATGVANVIAEDLGAVEDRLDAFASLLLEHGIVEEHEHDEHDERDDDTYVGERDWRDDKSDDDDDTERDDDDARNDECDEDDDDADDTAYADDGVSAGVEAALINMSSFGLSTGPPRSRRTGRRYYTHGRFVPPEVPPENQGYFDEDEIEPDHYGE